jgi:hypothetical protein
MPTPLTIPTERDNFRVLDEWRRKLKAQDTDFLAHVADTTIHFTEESIDHSNIDELEWSNAGHTIDTSVDFDGNDIVDAGDIATDSITAADGAGPININHDFDFNDNSITNIDEVFAGSGVSGILTLGGTGGTNNEDITLDFESTANEILVSTSTGANLLKFDSHDFEISKVDPEIKLTDTGDSNSTRITRSDTSAVAQRFNTVLQLGAVGNALAFDGIDDCIDVGDTTEIDAATKLTLSAWVNVNNTATFKDMLVKWNGGGWFTSIDISEKLAVAFETAKVITSTNAVTTGSYQHVAIIYDGTAVGNANRLKMYINGSQETVIFGAFSVPASIKNNGGTNTTIGCLGASQYFDGDLDELAIWEDALSENKILDLYNSGNGLFIRITDEWPTDGGLIGTSIIGLWHHNESVMNSAPGGTDTEDSSGNGYHGTTSGSMTDGDFVPGKISISSTDAETSVWKAEDGTNPLEKGIITFSDADGRTIIKGGDVANTGIRFEIGASEVGKIDGTTKIFSIDEGITIPNDNKSILFGAGEDSGISFDGDSMNIVANLVTGSNALEFTAGSYTFKVPTSTDIVIDFIGTLNSGRCTWMQAEDYFAFADDINMSGETIYGNSTNSGNLTLMSTSHATKGLVIFNNTTTGMVYDGDNESASIGGGSNSHTINGVVEKSIWEFHTDGNTQPGGTTYHRHSNTANLSADATWLKSSGDHSTPTVVADGEELGHLRFGGYDGTDYALAAEIGVFVDDATVGNDAMGGEVLFSTSAAGAQTPLEVFRINSSQNILVATDNQVLFRDSAIGVYSQADTFMDLFADGAVRIGNSSGGGPTTYLALEPAGDAYWVGDGSGLQYAQIYEEDGSSTLALAAQDTFYQIVSFSVDGENNGATPDHTNDHITISKAGRYLVSSGISVQSATANEYDFHVQKNNGATDFPALSMHLDTNVANKTVATSTSGIVDLAANDTLELWVERLDGGGVSKTITIINATLSVTQIGGT